jgi:hypothetical protein
VFDSSFSKRHIFYLCSLRVSSSLRIAWVKGATNMASEYTVRVHFIDGSERIVPAKDIRHVGDEGARRAIALDAGRGSHL